MRKCDFVTCKQHPRSLIRAFVVPCLDSIISLDSIAEISRLQLPSVAAQASLCLAWSETPEDTFCRVVAHFLVCYVQLPIELSAWYFVLIVCLSYEAEFPRHLY